MLRLVASRPMWDGGAFVQHSPSVGALAPPLELRAHPDDLAQLGMTHTSRARVSAPSSGRAGLLVTIMADPSVARGTAVLPFNLPQGGAGQLIDALADYTEISLEKVDV
jgi:hypothetical protein